jgi:signal transduction histidine kinase
LLQFLTYQTPSKFSETFNEHSANSNLRFVKIISSLLPVISGFSRSLTLFFHDEILKIDGYAQFSINNWAQIIGSSIFLLLSIYALRNQIALHYKKTISVAFVTYFLTSSFYTSYIVSQHNTKNTLFVFLVGMVVASLFFTIELRELRFIVIYIVGIYIVATCLSDIPLQQKIINFIAGFILGIVFLSFSRYSYFFKSSHFVQIKELEEKNQEIAHLSIQKGEILSFVAHDLRAPLNNIEALSKILLAENEHNAAADMIWRSAQQAKNIINDLIEAVKADQSEIKTERIPLAPYIGKIIDKWQANSGRKIEYSQNVNGLKLNINASKLERVIDNIISNAFKFSAADKAISVTIEQISDKVSIEIKDFGIGIPAPLQPHVFDQFSKAGRLGLKGEKSIGLGLHISNKIIAQHHGELLVYSEENKGTTFTIRLPLAEEAKS